MNPNPPPRNSGVSLIVVLGALSVLALLALAMAKVLRSERFVARGNADEVRARQLAHAAIARAMERVDETMVGKCEPEWTPNASAFATNVLCSSGSPRCPDLWPAPALALLPRAVRGETALAATNAAWSVLIGSDGRTNGRIAFAAVNVSGFLDANRIGGRGDRIWSTNINELEVWNLDEIEDGDAFLSDRQLHRRYEDAAELARLNGGLTGTVHVLFPYSYDPGRDQFFTNAAHLGRRDIALFPKFNLNAITNFVVPNRATDVHAYANDAAFMSGYFHPLSNALVQAGFEGGRARSIAWNIVNYLDDDRLPHSDGPCPWRDATVEPVPLVNEIIVEPLAETPGKSNQYAFTIEVFYPFAPPAVAPEDGFFLQVGVFTNEVTDAPETEIMAHAVSAWSFVAQPIQIGQMAFSTNDSLAMRCYMTPTCSFAHVTGDPPRTEYLPLSTNHALYVLVRVLQIRDGVTNIVDEAMGYERNNADKNRALMRLTHTGAWSVNDPRLNGRVEYWTAASATPGLANATTDPLGGGRQGLLCFHRDGPMLNIAEIGCIADLGGEDYATGHPWNTLDPLRNPTHAALLDRLTVRRPRQAHRGRLGLPAAHELALKALFQDAPAHFTNEWGMAVGQTLSETDAADLAAVIRSYAGHTSFSNLFAIPAIADAFAFAGTNGLLNNDLFLAGDWLREAPLRAMAELVSFRQNLFLVAFAVQVPGTSGRGTVAERRGVALVFRDTYTGAGFVHSLRWL